MREQLIRLLQEAEGQAAYYDGDDAYGVAADYLLDNGVIVPQVKVGEVVWYFTSKYSTVIQAAEVLGIYYNGTWWSFMLKLNNNVICEAICGIDEVYTTREDAEAALKARGNEKCKEKQ